ncbi:MAG: hypothetical protein J6P33_04280 [Spirochaetales bacterium]|nr:hypothetical protein [Spirochaetales bacterium]
MNKKTVSILLITIITIAITLFSVTSCKNEPKIVPTAAPEPGYVPEIPNNITPLSKIGEDDLKAINALGEGLGRFFADYSGKYKTSLESILKAELTLSKPISISAPDGEGSFRTKAFTYKGLKGEIAFRTDPSNSSATEKSLFLIFEGKVTSEVFGGEHTVKMTYDLLEDNPYYFFLDGSAKPSFYVDYNYDRPANYKYYNSESTDPLTDETAKSAVKTKTDLLMFIGYKALAEATVDVEDMQVVMKDDKDNILSAGITGQIKLSGVPLSAISNDVDFFDSPIDILFKSFTATVQSLNVTATLSTKAGNDTESLSATLSLSNLSLGVTYGDGGNDGINDEDLTTVSLEHLALSAWNSDDSVILSLEISDFDLSAEMSHSPIINISTTLGLGIKADDSSFGVVTDFELYSGKMSGVPFINFTSKAAVINGSYYQPEGITESLYDYFDLALSTISKFMIRRN